MLKIAGIIGVRGGKCQAAGARESARPATPPVEKAVHRLVKPESRTFSKMTARSARSPLAVSCATLRQDAATSASFCFRWSPNVRK